MGGLWDGCYHFTYYPSNKEGNNDTWSFDLTREQIHSIARGELKALDLWACTQDSCQCKSMNENDTCFRHDYFDDGKPDPSKLTREEIDMLDEEKRKLFEKWKVLNLSETT